MEVFKYDAVVFIGRFQPFHLGHKSVIDEALKYGRRVIVLVGGANNARSTRNPFTFEERKKMIERVYPRESGSMPYRVSQLFTTDSGNEVYTYKRLEVVPLDDYPYNDNKWMEQVQKLTYSYTGFTPDAPRIALIGHNKDNSSYYLKMFPKWDSINVENTTGINSTDIRREWLSGPEFIREDGVGPTVEIQKFYLEKVPETVKEFVKPYTEIWNLLNKEYDLIEKYKLSWEVAPFPPTFVTVDAVVVQSGHILLIKRKAAPGIGQWALPGGFINEFERLEDAALRELKEETKIKVPLPVLRGSIKDRKVFDYPYRSTRGRTITHGFFIDLGTGELPKVTGADDAEKAKWVPFKDVKSDELFEDHYAIIDTFINL